MPEARMARQSPIVKANKEVNGRKVINRQGESLGKVEEVMIDSVPGRVAYAVVSFGGFLGLGDKLFAVPWNSLDWDVEREAFVMNADKEFLKNAPGFDKNDWPNMSDTSWRSNVYSYYSATPYWE
jgi:sporulation protein YlmC with PRC-barrel domain